MNKLKKIFLMNNGTYYKKENKSLEPILFFLNLIILRKQQGGSLTGEDRSPTRSNTVASEFFKLKQSKRKVAITYRNKKVLRHS